jgi:hypothetical protein
MRSFDFTSVDQPRLEITLDRNTVLHLEVPTVSVVMHLKEAIPLLRDAVNAAKNKDLTSIRQFYGVLAEIMSCNAERLEFTADELEKKYRISLTGMLAFFIEYQKFIIEVSGEKN